MIDFISAMEWTGTAGRGVAADCTSVAACKKSIADNDPYRDVYGPKKTTFDQALDAWKIPDPSKREDEMSRTVVIGYAKKADAVASAANYSNDYAVMVIGPTDQVMVARETDDGVVWRSGPDGDLYVMVATKDPIAQEA